MKNAASTPQSQQELPDTQSGLDNGYTADRGRHTHTHTHTDSYAAECRGCVLGHVFVYVCVYAAAAGKPGLSTGQVVGISFLCTVAFCVAGVAAVAGWRWWRRRGSERGYTELIDKDTFVSLSDNPR
jgi:hypothetical protein